MSGVFPQAVALLSYLVLILAINWPIRAQRSAYSGTCAFSFLFALASTFFLPWTGIPMANCLGLPPEISYFWYPSIVLAVFFADKTKENIAPKSAWLFCVTLSVLSLTWFAYRNGTPGFVFSIETLCTLLRLEGLRNGRFCAAMILFALSLVLSFCEIPRNAVCRLTSFSYAAGICLIFLPVDTAAFFPLTPVASLPADFLVSLVLAILIQNVLFKWTRYFLAHSRVHCTRLLTQTLFALAGTYFLLTSTGW